MAHAKGEPKTIQVIEVGQTPRGTRTVRGAGQNESYLVGRGVAPPSVGHTIDALVSSSRWDGKLQWWINDWRLADIQARPARDPMFEGPPGGDGAPVRPTADAEMRFISNVVGQAILAKTITEPGQISEWALAAKQSLADLEGP